MPDLPGSPAPPEVQAESVAEVDRYVSDWAAALRKEWLGGAVPESWEGNPLVAEALLEAGFTGTVRDKLGRKVTFANGKLALTAHPDPDSAPVEEGVQEESKVLAVPDVRQSLPYDCGAAAVMAVCRFFGVGPDAEEDYVRALGTTAADGTPPANMVRFLDGVGLRPSATERMEVPDLAGLVATGRPVICCIQDWEDEDRQIPEEGSGHWVVVVGADDDTVRVQDPWAGPQEMPAKEFLARWQDRDAALDYVHYGIAPRPPQGGGAPVEEADAGHHSGTFTDKNGHKYKIAGGKRVPLGQGEEAPKMTPAKTAGALMHHLDHGEADAAREAWAEMGDKEKAAAEKRLPDFYRKQLQGKTAAPAAPAAPAPAPTAPAPAAHPPGSGPTPHPTRDEWEKAPPEDVHAVVQAVGGLAGKDNQVGMADVRDALPREWDRKRQDVAIAAARAAGHLSASAYEGREGLVQRNHDAGLTVPAKTGAGSQTLGYLHLKNQ